MTLFTTTSPFNNISNSGGRLSKNKKDCYRFVQRQRISSSRRRGNVVCSSSSSSSPSIDDDINIDTMKKIVIVGGTGRVGSSAATAIQKAFSDLNKKCSITVASRNSSSAAAAAPLIFCKCDVNDIKSIERCIVGADLVINTAGPFQTVKTCNVLEACINVKVPNYLDVCDDGSYAQNDKKLNNKCKQANVSAITSCGIYPGVSNIIAAKAIENQLADAKIARERREDDDESSNNNNNKENVDDDFDSIEYVLYNYFTAGSGGVGTTILATSFLLCGEDVILYENGEKVKAEPASNRKVVDFGKGVGKREVFLYNLPEVQSTHDVFNVPTVKARFGTSPGIWNAAMVAMARALPKDVLESKETMQNLATFTMPIVKLVDLIVGEKMSIKIDVKLKNGKVSTSLFTHPKLSECVGTSVSAFALAMLFDSKNDDAAGVYYPEEAKFVDTDRLLERCSKGCSTFEISQAPWKLESQPINIGFGISFE